ncbi:uncharacterized protein LOC111638908 [Centruroides sculpturatus]|uniref:uncharacterized protein LOC111634821 n=1 Tax=Centruroides sculpturatus TaxID=218467 RepID=UPI000C6DD69D|nr:uncharacterized protein LOC111634821 [Centruroides sculpturatus]XP_023240446.1 uncharacterized protein LOC111638908 [Centruroides sculpturatus]
MIFKAVFVLSCFILITGYSFYSFVVRTQPECARLFQRGRVGFLGCLKLKVENHFSKTFCSEENDSWLSCLITYDFNKRDCNLINEFMQDYFPDESTIMQNIYNRICCKSKRKWGLRTFFEYLGNLPFDIQKYSRHTISKHITGFICPIIGGIPFNGYAFLGVIATIFILLIGKFIHRWWCWKKSQKRKRKLYAY